LDKRYNKNDPVEVARIWTQRGAKLIHIIDLDAALYKNPNTDLILNIAKKHETSLQVGGGIRTPETARKVILSGADVIVTGTLIESEEDTTSSLREMISSMEEGWRERKWG